MPPIHNGFPAANGTAATGTIPKANGVPRSNTMDPAAAAGATSAGAGGERRPAPPPPPPFTLDPPAAAEPRSGIGLTLPRWSDAEDGGDADSTWSFLRSSSGQPVMSASDGVIAAAGDGIDGVPWDEAAGVCAEC